MKLQSRILIPMLGALILLAAGCDTHEDPNLLNPPLPDSTRVRVVNLAGDPVDVSFPGIPITSALGSFQISPYHSLLILDQTLLFVTRPDRSRTDTALNQTLTRGAKLTYFIFGRRDTTLIVPVAVGEQEETDLTTAKEARLTFINGIDSSSYYLKVGCQSGETLFTPQGFAQFPPSITTTSRDLSLYLFNAADSSKAVASARVQPQIGTGTYIVAAMKDGRPGLFILPDAQNAGTLQEAEPETRTTATVELLNALPDNRTITAQLLDASGVIASGVAPLTISSPADVEACVRPQGDSLVVTSDGGGRFSAPIRLAVASRSIVAVYEENDSTKALTLPRDLSQEHEGQVHLRGVNLSGNVRNASISVGAGGPSTLAPDFRPFGTLRLGNASAYVRLPAGTYPFVLNSADNGRFLNGGVQSLDPGFYTLFVVDQDSTPTLMLVRDDQPGATLSPLQSSGVRVNFFNVMPDDPATFTAGPLSLPDLLYSYVYSTVLPFNVTTVTSNAGTATIDLTRGSYTIGATASGGNRKLMAFRTADQQLPFNKASVRFLNAIPDAPPLAIRIGDSAAAAVDTASFGNPTLPRQLDERKYSIFVTAPDNTTILTRSDGVEIRGGRRYLLIIAPKRTGSTQQLQYETLWMQE